MNRSQEQALRAVRDEANNAFESELRLLDGHQLEAARLSNETRRARQLANELRRDLEGFDRILGEPPAFTSARPRPTEQRLFPI